MDLNDLQLALPSSNDSNAEYTFASPRQQDFSLPYPIMKYIFTNPSSGKAWKKLIQTCKYFFPKNSIYPVKCFESFGESECNIDGEIFDSTKNIPKLWIYDRINVNSFSPTLLSSLIPKIEKYDLRSLEILRQDLTYDEYQFLTSSGDVKELKLWGCTICHFDGTLVTFGQLIANIPNIEIFFLECDDNSSSMFQPDTFKKLADNSPCLNKLYHFRIFCLTEEFDFASITDFIMKNEKLFIYLSFDDDLPLSDAYKEILESFIAKVIETPPKRIPIIYFPGFEDSVYFKDYRKLYDSRK